MKKILITIVSIIAILVVYYVGETFEFTRHQFPERKIIAKEYRLAKDNNDDIKIYKDKNKIWVTYNKRAYRVDKDKKFTESDLKEYDQYTEPVVERLNTNEQSTILNRKYSSKVKDIVSNYKDINSKNDVEKYTNIVKYIVSLNLNYSQKNPNNQINNIEKGYTACLGITWLQKQLLDRSGIEYKIVSFRPYNFETNKIDYYNKGHIILHVKLNGDWYISDMTDLISGSDNDRIPPEGFVEEVLESKIDYKENYYGLTYNYVKNKNYNDVIQIVSPTMKSGKIVQDNGFTVKQRTMSFEEYLDNKGEK